MLAGNGARLGHADKHYELFSLREGLPGRPLWTMLPPCLHDIIGE